MKTFVLAAALMALAAPVRAQTALPVTVSAATKSFVANAAMTDTYEMAAGHLAVKKAEGPA